MNFLAPFRHVVGTLSRFSAVLFSKSFVGCLRRCRSALALLWLATVVPLGAAEFYVTTTGSSSGNGSQTSPWDLQTALNQPSSVKAGDTIWVHGGTHRIGGLPAKFTSKLTGTASSPIIVRAYPDERATVDGNLGIYSGGYVTFWGLEITDSLSNRTTTQSGPWPTDWQLPDGTGNVVDYCVSGADVRVPGAKLINCIIHDNIGGGIGTTVDAVGSEIYGCLSYYNGWQGSDQGHGHGLYLQNSNPNPIQIIDSMLFANYALGAQATGSTTGLADYVVFEGNAIFENSVLATSAQMNFLIGTYVGAEQGAILRSNTVYDLPGKATTIDSYLGYSGGTVDAVFQDNYFATAVMLGTASGLTMTGNQFLGNTFGFSSSTYPSNTYGNQPTSGTKVIVRPNQYESGRANLIIYNWGQANTVTVDISSIGLSSGDTYELHNAQDFYGDILTGTYTGGAIAVPMTGHTVAAPTSHAAPASTFPKFGAFVLVRTGDGTGNTPPTISSIANQTVNANTTNGPLPVTVGDAQMPASSLTLTVDSSNVALVPNSAVVLGGSGANRTITVTPAANQTGGAAITVSVTDGVLVTDTTFTLTVNPVPTSSSVAGVSLKFTGSDVVLTFPTVSNRVYYVQTRTNLVSGSWSTIATNIIGTGGLMTNQQVGAGTERARFYRIGQASL
jgi:hypothetical protein